MELIIVSGMAVAFSLGFAASSVLTARRLRTIQNDTWRQARLFFSRKQREEM